VGPFYCPADQKVYIDPDFFQVLAQKHRAPGDFAAAFVIAHEVAHHVQALTGFAQRVNQVRAQGNEVESNRWSVRLELQADYLAGVWAHHADKRFNVLEEGDIEEAINAANRIGDDVLMREAGLDRVKPDLFTHGTSEQRSRWFRRGFSSGDFEGCNQLFDLDYTDL
jgi:predicted metalloprotease